MFNSIYSILFDVLIKILKANQASDLNITSIQEIVKGGVKDEGIFALDPRADDPCSLILFKLIKVSPM